MKGTDAMKNSRWLLAWMLTALLVVSDAQAQFGGGFGRGMRGGDRDRNSGNPAGHVERPPATPDPASYEQIDYRLMLLEEDLRLAPPQINVWQSFAGKVRAFASDQAREQARLQGTNAMQPVGLQHIGQVVDGERNRLTALEDIESAATALYRELTAEQKILADMRMPSLIMPRRNGNGSVPIGVTSPPAPPAR
jgi:hypothetical protein